MGRKILIVKSREHLAAHIVKKRPSFYFSSQTSTVIPYDDLHKVLEGVDLVDLSQLPPEMEMEDHHLICRGGVTWQEAKAYCREHGREVITSPTEELANVLAGVATSCTGERCFGYGTLRQQIIALKIMNDRGQLQQLKSKAQLSSSPLFQNSQGQSLLREYQESYQEYENFKNAPFPRLQVETDLMIGLEGQLGIVVEVELKTMAKENLQYLFLELPQWEEDYSPHLEILLKVQPLRHLVNCCELLDSNSMASLEGAWSLAEGKDFIFLEIPERNFSAVYEKLIRGLDSLHESQVYEMSQSQFHQLRMAVPRNVFEQNSRKRVIKRGTDIQVRPQEMAFLLDLYRKLAQLGISYNLFGHFGDSHLHFNFMPSSDQVGPCDQSLKNLYEEVQKVKASPFAEHGIGILKQKFIRPFLQDVHLKMFQYLKSEMDPQKILFPHGYLNL